MSTTTATGFCRVTVVAPDTRIDVALPEDIAVADLHPEIRRILDAARPAGSPQPAGTLTGHHLVRRDGTVLDSARTLAAQRVLDGELLSLRPFADSLPPPVFDDVADAVAAAVAAGRRPWSGELLRGAALSGGALLFVLLAGVLWSADPVRHTTHGLPAVIGTTTGLLLAAFAGVRARVYADHTAAAALGLSALPLMMTGGAGIIAPGPGEGPGRLQFLLGAITALIVAVALVALTPEGGAPFVGGVVAAGAGTLAAFAAILTEGSVTGAAAVCAVATLGLIAFLPGLSTRFAGMPIGYTAQPGLGGPAGEDPLGRPADSYPGQSATDRDAVPPRPVDAPRVAFLVRRGHELLLGLLGGCAAVITGCAALLGFSDQVWARLLALSVGTAMLMRARLFRYAAQVICSLGAGITVIALLSPVWSRTRSAPWSPAAGG